MFKKVFGTVAAAAALTAVMTISVASEARAELAYRRLLVTTGIIVDGGRVTMSPDYSFRPNILLTNRLVAQLSGPNCRSYVQAGQYTGNPRPLFAQRMNRFADGSFEVAFGSLNWTAFEISQAYGTAPSVCDLHLYALLDSSVTPAPVNPVNPVNPVDPGNPPSNPVDVHEELLGVVNYSGGFGRDLPVVLSGRNTLDGFVTTIRVAIPEFCKQTEVLDAGTISEGKFDPATPTRNLRNTFIVNGGQGLRASEILVTLNGPFDAQCGIPVYVQMKR